jgi:hypothetical protein
MILMPKQNRTTFEMHCIEQGSMTTAECMNEWLNPVKAEPDNEARKEELLKFSLALLETMQKDLAMTANGVRKGSPFGPPQESALIVCFVWLGMPEMCQEVLKFTHCPSLGYLWRDLRVPVLRSGGIMRYRSFLTEALTDTEDFAQVCDALLALVGPPDALFGLPEEIELDPDELAWCQQMIKAALSSCPPHKRVSHSDVITLLRICGSFGSNVYAERYFLRPTPKLNEPSNLGPQCVALRDRARCTGLSFRTFRMGVDGAR